MNNNKLLWFMVILLTAGLVSVIGGKFLINKISDHVIQKLQREYSPSPYGPGINPDLIDLSKILKK